MSLDRFHDGEDVEPARVRELRPVPGLERGSETRGRADLAAAGGARDRAIGELAAENAELYRRNAEQSRTIEQLQARLDTSEVRFRAWAKDMANREDARAARDQARDKREETMVGRMTELEHKLADRPASTDPGGPDSRLSGQEPTDRQAAKRNPERLWRTNEAIQVYTAGGGALLAGYADTVGTGTVQDAAGIAGGLLMFGAAVIALARKRREGS